jgi:hypothetical protein
MKLLADIFFAVIKAITGVSREELRDEFTRGDAESQRHLNDLK